MTVPYRRWLSFDLGMLEGFYSGAGDSPDDWTLLNLGRYVCKLGMSRESTYGNYYWHSVFRPRRGLGFESLDGMDEIVDVTWKVTLYRQHLYDECNVTQFDVIQGFMDNDNPWHFQRVTGRYYDGENEWDVYPPGQYPGYDNPTVVITEATKWRHEHLSCVMHSWKAGGGNRVEANRYQDDFFRNCAHFKLDNYSPALAAGKRCRIILRPSYMDVRYFNPVVNECRVDDVVQYWVPINTAVEFKLIGMGFDNDDDELDGDGNVRPADWVDNFEDGWRNTIWTDEPNNGTIVESGGVLTLAIANAVDGEWWQPNKENSPFAKLSPGLTNITVITKLNSFTVNNDTAAGLIIGNTTNLPDNAGGYCYSFQRLRSDGGGLNGLYLRDMGKGAATPAYVAVTTLPIWLRIVATGSGAGSSIDFDYSTDGENWITLATRTNLTWSFIGLNARNWGAADNAISAPFEFFGYYGEAGRWGDLVDVIEFWRQQNTARLFWRDDFSAVNIDSIWSTHNTDANRTITQAGGVLTIGIAVNGDARWASTLNKAPKIYRDVPDRDTFEVVTKINPFMLNNYCNAGIWIGYPTGIVGGLEACRLMLRRYDGVGNLLQVGTCNSGWSDWCGPGSGDLPIWLKIKVTAGVISFWYRYSTYDWVQITKGLVPWNLSGVFESGMKIGLHCSVASTVHSGIQAPFEYFEVNWGGSPYATLVRADGDFTVDSNLQITIPSNKFPMLEEGSYILRVIKKGMDFSTRNALVDVWGWAGDWRCTTGGMISEGERIVIESRVGPIFRYPREKRGSIILIEADKQHKATLAVSKEWWSEDDVRAPDKFYEGIVLETSTFRRGLDDKIGLFKTADMTLKLSNHKKKFSELLNTYDFKNQLVKLYHAFIDEPESWKTHIVTMIIEDYNIEGTSFEMIMKDVSQKYFGGDVPQSLCIKGDEVGQFPNLHDDYVEGFAMPDVLGLAQLTEGEYKGAVQAIYVDTTAYKYLAAGGSLHSITEVYADNVIVSASLYEIVYEDGHTFIIFDDDQGDSIITFNCTGYMYEGWNSANGYIQNPAWILAYYLIRILSVPLFLLDYATFTTLANIYIAMTEETSGKLILQEQRGSREILRELCFSFGVKCWVAKNGSFSVGRKSLTGISSDIVVFEQTDLLSPVRRKMGMKDFITRLSGRFNYIPFHRLFLDAAEQNRDDLEDRFGEKEDRVVGRRPPRE